MATIDDAEDVGRGHFGADDVAHEEHGPKHKSTVMPSAQQDGNDLVYEYTEWQGIYMYKVLAYEDNYWTVCVNENGQIKYYKSQAFGAE